MFLFTCNVQPSTVGMNCHSGRLLKPGVRSRAICHSARLTPARNTLQKRPSEAVWLLTRLLTRHHCNRRNGDQRVLMQYRGVACVEHDPAYPIVSLVDNDGIIL